MTEKCNHEFHIINYSVALPCLMHLSLKCLKCGSGKYRHLWGEPEIIQEIKKKLENEKVQSGK